LPAVVLSGVLSGLLVVLLAACRAAPLPEPEPPPRPFATDTLEARHQAPEVALRGVPLPPVAAASRPVAGPLALPSGDEEALFRVGGRPVTRADLGDQLLRYHPEDAARALAQVVDQAVVLAEAQREGVTVDDDAVRAHAESFLAERRREARVQHGALSDPDRLLEERYGRSLDTLRGDLARLARATLLRDRLVRLDQLRRPGVEVRVLVLASETAARSVAAQLRTGADMTLLAERAGLRSPVAPPPLAPGDVVEPDLRELLFAAQEGAVLGPLRFEDAARRERAWWQVLKVVRCWPLRTEPWSALRGEVEARLALVPVTGDEVQRWRQDAYARQGVVRRDAWRGYVPVGLGPAQTGPDPRRE
jgi:hypothetical protein